MKRFNIYLISFLGGLLYASSFPMKDIPPLLITGILGFFCLIYALSDLRNKSLKTSLLLVFSFCIGYNLLGYYWIPHTLKTFGGIYFPFNFLLSFIFSLIVAPHLFFFALFYYYFRKLKGRFSLIIYHLILSFSFVFLEYFIPQQFPAHLGHTWLPLAPYLFLAPYLGAPIYSLISIWLVFGSYEFIVNKKIDFALWVMIFLTVLTHIFFPLTINYKKSDLQIQLRLVQANIGNLIKISSESGFTQAVAFVENEYTKLSLSPQKDKIDLIIWPETAYPSLLKSNRYDQFSGHLPMTIKNIVEKADAEFFFGGYDSKRDLISDLTVETEYNTAFFIGRDYQLKKLYHKIKLIPFGEGLPFGKWNKYLKKYINNISYFAKGENYSLFQTDKGIYFSSAICYEILFSSFIRKYLNKVKSPPHFMINLTNDSWYGDTAEPMQHLFLAKWRALEFQIPIVRSTNTGISSVLYPDGSESRRLSIGEKKYLDISLILNSQTSSTFFQVWGIWGLFFILPFVMFIYFIEKIWKNKLA